MKQVAKQKKKQKQKQKNREVHLLLSTNECNGLRIMVCINPYIAKVTLVTDLLSNHHECVSMAML